MKMTDAPHRHCPSTALCKTSMSSSDHGFPLTRTHGQPCTHPTQTNCITKNNKDFMPAHVNPPAVQPSSITHANKHPPPLDDAPPITINNHLTMTGLPTAQDEPTNSQHFQIPPNNPTTTKTTMTSLPLQLHAQRHKNSACGITRVEHLH